MRFHERTSVRWGATPRSEGIQSAKRFEVGMVVLKRDATILVVRERTRQMLHIDDYRVQRRAGKGIITVNRTEKTGDVVGAWKCCRKTRSCS